MGIKMWDANFFYYHPYNEMSESVLVFFID